MSDAELDHPDNRLRAVAATQFGLVTRAQAAGVGLGSKALARRIARGEWVGVSRRVLRAASAPTNEMTWATAALLHVGRDAALATTSALAFWGVQGFRLEPVELARRRGGTTLVPGLCRVHTSTAFDDGHVSEVDGIRVTTPLRTVFDLAGHLHPDRTARLLDTCHNRGLVSWPALHRMVDELGRRGRSGTAVMRELAAERPAGHRPPESRLEARVNEVLVRSGHRPLTPQVDLGDERWIGRVDLVDRDDLIALEVQSERFHGSLSDQRRDAERTGRLSAAGWLVIEVDDFTVWHRPGELVALVQEARRVSRARRFTTAA